LAVGTLALVLGAGALALAVWRPARVSRAGEPGDFKWLGAGRGQRASARGAFSSQLRRSLPTQARDRAGRPHVAEPPAPAPRRPADGAVLGYATVSVPQSSRNGNDVKGQVELIARECERNGLALLEVVREREPNNGKELERPGLEYALRRISDGEARGLVVSELSRLSRSAAHLGVILEWFTRSDARLIAVAEEVDTHELGGQLACRALVEVSRWERERHRERTRSGLQAARTKGRRAVADDRDLVQRINEMRAEGMTLQAIADRLNADAVPTVRGGVKWRPSSVQAAAGYKRPRRRPLGSLSDDRSREEEQ
jgi:DNA invertase Pin-like site-specific DNA recombinase